MPSLKFQVITLPPQSSNENFMAINNIHKRFKDFKIFSQNICLHGDPDSLQRLLKKDELEPDIIASTTINLLGNLHNSQKFNAGNYVYNKGFAKFIEQFGSITIHKRLGSKEKAITFCHATGENEGKTGITKFQDNYPENTKNIWHTYTKTLATLQNYLSPIKTNPITHKDIKNSFLLIIKLADQHDLFRELFLDYTQIIKSLDKETLDLIKEQEVFQKSIIASHNLVEFFVQITVHIEEAKYFLEVAEKLIEQAKIDPTKLSEVDKTNNLKELEADYHWYKGIVLVQTNDNLKAIKHLKKYYKYNPDKGTVSQLYYIYQKIGNQQEANHLYNKHKDFFPYLSKIINLIENDEYTPLESLKDFFFEDKYNIIIFNLKYAISLANTEKIIDYKLLLKEEIANKKESFYRIPDIFKVRANLLLNNDDTSENIKKIIKKLPDSNVKSELLHEMSVLYSLTNNKIALKYIELALTYEPSNSIYLEQKYLLDVLNNYQKILSSSPTNTPENTSSASSEEIEAATKLPKVKTRKATDNNNILSYTEAIDGQNPLQIQKYFEFAKEQLLMQGINPDNKQAGWLIDQKTVISFSDTKNISPNLYAAIEPNLALNESDNKHWSNILSKGFTNRSHGENGIKYFKVGDNRFYELKDVTMDDRLLATGYKNENNKLLLLFSKICNHNEVTNNHYQEFPCANYYEDNDTQLVGAEGFTS